LLFAKKIKKFYSLPHKHLAISVNRKMADFRTKRASLCKGWGDYFFLVGVKVSNRKQSKNRKDRVMKTKLQICEDCDYSVPAGSAAQPTLICRHQAGAELPWQVVEANGACINFERSRELVPLDIEVALAEGAKLIALSQDKFAIVDAEDYEWLSKYKWCASRKERVFYARRNERWTRRQIIMHRFILNAPKGLFVDHINHNGLDNRRSNLRLCTRAENNRNRRPNIQPNQWSKYKGVSFDKKREVFRAFIYRNKKQYYLGSFKNDTDAAKAYDKKARELFGEFAYLNFPEGF
jgi:hypothetical protein